MCEEIKYRNEPRWKYNTEHRRRYTSWNPQFDFLKPKLQYDNDSATKTLPQQNVPETATAPKRPTRILARRYPLTTTGFKYLEIGMNVEDSYYVEIAIGDNRGTEIILSYEMWKGLVGEEENILRLLQHPDKASYINIGPLTIRLNIFKNVKVLHICYEEQNKYIAVTEPTLLRMVTLDDCIDNMFNWICSKFDRVESQYRDFSHIARRIVSHDIRDIISTIRNGGLDYDPDDIVDCELVRFLAHTL